VIVGNVGKREALDEAMTQFALAYSQQNDCDYAELQKAVRSHRVRDAKVF
jgi:hypothetical protein